MPQIFLYSILFSICFGILKLCVFLSTIFFCPLMLTDYWWPPIILFYFLLLSDNFSSISTTPWPFLFHVFFRTICLFIPIQSFRSIHSPSLCLPYIFPGEILTWTIRFEYLSRYFQPYFFLIFGLPHPIFHRCRLRIIFHKSFLCGCSLPSFIFLTRRIFFFHVNRISASALSLFRIWIQARICHRHSYLKNYNWLTISNYYQVRMQTL